MEPAIWSLHEWERRKGRNMKDGQKTLRARMTDLVSERSGVRVNGKPASDKTKQLTLGVMLETCNRLWRLGYEIENPENIREKHIEALVRSWYDQGLAAKTIQNQRSVLKKFSGWIGKPGLVKTAQEYVPEAEPGAFVVNGVATKSKSWSENGLNVEEMIHKAEALDDRLADLLRLELLFGLRVNEVLQIKLWEDDHGHYLNIRPGIGKGGRPRCIPIETEIQRVVLNYVKSRYKKTEHMGWKYTVGGKAGSLEASRARYYRGMRALGAVKSVSGVSGHGLRAEYAENKAMLHGLIPATLGGEKGQMSREDERIVLGRVSEALGHSEKRGEAIGSAYYGKLRSSVSKRAE